MRSLLALLILAAALAVGACNSDGGGSPSPTLNPIPTQVTSPDVSPDTSPAASPSA